MIIELKDRNKGYSSFYKDSYDYKHSYTINTDKIAFISDGDSESLCIIHFVNGEKIKFHSLSYENIIQIIYGNLESKQ